MASFRILVWLKSKINLIKGHNPDFESQSIHNYKHSNVVVCYCIIGKYLSNAWDYTSSQIRPSAQRG